MLYLAVALTALSFAVQPELANLPHPDPAVVGVEAATQQYLDAVPHEKRTRSDAYFEGGYWLMLWRFLWLSAGPLVLLHFGLSARLRDLAGRLARSRCLQPAPYWAGFTLYMFFFTLPLTIYAGFIRPRWYGFSRRSFGDWFADALTGLGVELVVGAIFAVIFYAAVRLAGRAWWVWGTAVAIAYIVFNSAIAPVYVEPLFNTYRPVQDAGIRDRVLRMARANGIEVGEVWEMDASRQTTQITAKVSGLLGTERIVLYDNLLKRTSPNAVVAVTGHEIGHYVLSHRYEMLAFFAVLYAVFFAATARLFPALASRYASRWRITGVDDPAGLPLFMLILGVYLFLVTPVTNSFVRSNEHEADIFGLNAAREPEGWAEAALLLGDRKLHPGKLEETIFFDHPSAYSRVLTAMRWKAEHSQRTR